MINAERQKKLCSGVGSPRCFQGLDFRAPERNLSIAISDLDLPWQESWDQIYWLNKRDTKLNMPTFCLCRDASSLQLSQSLNRKHRSFPNWTTTRIADCSCITCPCYSISAPRTSSSMTKSELMRKASLSLSTRSWISSLTSLKSKLSNFLHNVIKRISECS